MKAVVTYVIYLLGIVLQVFKPIFTQRVLSYDVTNDAAEGDKRSHVIGLINAILELRFSFDLVRLITKIGT